MYKHRQAFPRTSKKSACQQNIDDVLNTCQVKMKELITKKQEIIAKTNLLIGQQRSLRKEIDYIKKYNEEKEVQIQEKEENLTKLRTEVKEQEDIFQKHLENSKQINLRFKEGINQNESDLANVADNPFSEYSKRKAAIKLKIEELCAEKELNKKLSETYFNLNHDLAILEVNFLYNFYFRLNMVYVLLKMIKMPKKLNKVLKLSKVYIISNKEKWIL